MQLCRIGHLLIPRLTPVGAALLVCTMTGAVLTQLVLIGGSPVPALVLSCFAAIILWGRFKSGRDWWPTEQADFSAFFAGVGLDEDLLNQTTCRQPPPLTS